MALESREAIRSMPWIRGNGELIKDGTQLSRHLKGQGAGVVVDSKGYPSSVYQNAKGQCF